MSPTERQFSFPIRLYEPLELSMVQEKEEATGVVCHIEGVVGNFLLPIEEIVAWQDDFTRPMGIDDVKERGFNATYIYTKNLGTHVCVWSRTKFEEKYNAHIEKLRNADT